MPVSHRTLTKSKRPFTFYLGVHKHYFLQRTNCPLFVSRRTLAAVRNPLSVTRWALDSGGFTELSMHGRWLTTPEVYAREVRHWYSNLYGMQWAAIQDWMCEPFILSKTGLSVEEHQCSTIENYCRLLELQPDIPWLPVLQGYKPSEYIDHLRRYESYGFDLTKLPIVGIGSVCRRQSKDVDEAEAIIREISQAGVRLHAFGFKITGLLRCVNMLVSADSMAWSYDARIKKRKLPGCTHRGNCANCLTWALEWHADVLSKLSHLI